MAFRPSANRLPRIPRLRRWLAVSMLPVCMFIDGLQIIGIAVKDLLIRKWSKEIWQKSNELRNIADCKDLDRRNNGCKNLSGLGGQSFNPAFVSWSELFQQCNDVELRKWFNCPNVIREHFFFAYFGPLESWCDHNCYGPYYLWTDERGVYRQFTEPMDDILWRMSWISTMPTLAEIDSLTK